MNFAHRSYLALKDVRIIDLNKYSTHCNCSTDCTIY